MSLLSALLACVVPEPDEVPDVEKPTPEVHEAEVKVVAYKEMNISKVEHVQKVHSYASFEVVNGPDAMKQHTHQGVLKINMRTDALAKLAKVPLVVGEQVKISATLSTSQSYLDLKKLTRPPAP